MAIKIKINRFGRGRLAVQQECVCQRDRRRDGRRGRGRPRNSRPGAIQIDGCTESHLSVGLLLLCHLLRVDGLQATAEKHSG